MEKELDETQLRGLLLRLCNDEALEIIRGDDQKLYIPYIMNDAAEAYCILSDVVIPAFLPDDLREVTSIDIAVREERRGLILRADEHIAATIWYGKCLYVQRLYQYHRIMHCWVDGYEHIRMLVNTIGIIRDKLEYLGKDACNETELSLIPLLEYRPFRFFSPIHESIDTWYPETKQGYAVMKAFAKEAGEEKLFRLINAGSISGKLLNKRISEQIAWSEKLFELLYRRICDASCVYEERSYEEPIAHRMEYKRNSVHEEVLKAGYTGNYPVYHKGRKSLLAFEEHPFTVPGTDDMEFDIHLLEKDPEKGKSKYRCIS